MKRHDANGLILALYTTSRGFAFALFEGPLAPVDWGIKEVRSRSKNALCLKHIGRLIETNQPDIVLLEDTAVRGSRRSPRIRRLYRAIAGLAHAHSVETYRYSRTAIRVCFGKLGASTKHEIAHVIARRVPAFEHQVPPIRRPWMTEHPRMGLFDAVALVFTFYLTELGHNLML